jgi:hypothetical protein
MDLICINECLPNHRDKYDFIDQMFSFNRSRNPEARFHYISNKATACPHVINHNIEEYKGDEYDKFNSSYIHLSDNPPSLERVWFLRWIILSAFMQKQNLSRILYLDNDVAIYTPLCTWPEQILNCSYSLSRGSSPHTNFINDPECLFRFVDYFQKVYQEPQAAPMQDLKNLRQLFIEKKQYGGVGDMTLWGRFSREDTTSSHIKDISDIVVNEFTFDHHINDTTDYESRDSRKNIKFKEGIPSCYNTKLSKEIKFHTLHFQGSAKSCLSNYLNYETGA